ncbi:HAUS augmin-like complex subunit 1 isoform X1 [Rhinoderma darwinii]|uniref:HAUS augmin-like complex subunit 1 isoform X1 n=1 Tax=Rhinoderma darwinii TaxID=43563 RepID=UPI003F666A21
MDEKSTKVNNGGEIILWLKKIFGDKLLPPYEVNTRTVDLLYQLAEWNEARDKDLTLVLEDQKLKTAEIKAEAGYLQELLTDSLGPSYTNLSRMGNTYLNQLVDSCLALEIKDSALASYIPAVNELSAELVTIEGSNQEFDSELTSLRKKLTNALVLEKTLEQDLRKAEEQCSVEKAKVEVRAQNLKKLKDKSEEYKYKIQTAKEQLSSAGMEDSLTHRSLVCLSETLTELKEQSTATNEKLKSYLDLAPNPSLVKVKIEEAKRELKVTEAELNAKVDMMEFELPEQKRRIT